MHSLNVCRFLYLMQMLRYWQFCPSKQPFMLESSFGVVLASAIDYLPIRAHARNNVKWLFFPSGHRHRVRANFALNFCAEGFLKNFDEGSCVGGLDEGNALGLADLEPNVVEKVESLRSFDERSEEGDGMPLRVVTLPKMPQDHLWVFDQDDSFVRVCDDAAVGSERGHHAYAETVVGEVDAWVNLFVTFDQGSWVIDNYAKHVSSLM